MTPYRTPDPPPLERWNITPKRKWYVKIVRLFVNLRAKYAERREYNQYLRDLADWHKVRQASLPDRLDFVLRDCKGKRPSPLPPMPLPPPVRIME